MIGIKHVFTTAYHPQTNGQVERFNKTLAARLRHYVADHQKDWDEFVQPLTYAYNMQVHRSTGTTPFNLVLSRQPPYIMTEPPSNLVCEADTPLSAAASKRNTLNRLRYALANAKFNLTKAQKRYKADFDRRVRFLVEVKPGQMVFIDKPKDHQKKKKDRDGEGHVTKKLAYMTTGPYKVVRADGNTVTVEDGGLLSTVSIDRVTVDPATLHATHQVGGEQPATAPSQNSEQQAADDPQPAIGEQPEAPTEEVTPTDTTPAGLDEEYVVERIVDHADTEEGRKYRVRWYGYTAKDDTWEVADRLPDNFITRYWRAVDKRKLPRRSGRKGLGRREHRE